MNTLRDARLGTTNLTQRRPLYTGVQRPSRWPLRRLTEPEGAKSPTGERRDLTEVFMASKFAAPNATATSLPEAFANASPRAGPDLAGKPAARDVAQQLWNALCDAKAANCPVRGRISRTLSSDTTCPGCARWPGNNTNGLQSLWRPSRPPNWDWPKRCWPGTIGSATVLSVSRRYPFDHNFDVWSPAFSRTRRQLSLRCPTSDSHRQGDTISPFSHSAVGLVGPRGNG